MDKETELLVDRHREAAFQHGFVTGFGMAAAGGAVGLIVAFLGRYLEWWK